MRQTSKQYSKQNSQDPKQFRGGEKKVMKKSLSLVVAAAMTLTTASVAFADTAAPTATELTSQQKFDALKEAGIFNGYPDGTAGLANEMTRAEFAKVLTKLAQLAENASAAKIYTDVPATHWAAGFIGSVTEAQIMNGVAKDKFAPAGKVTVEQIAKVADILAGVDESTDAVSGKVSGWAKGYVAAAIKAGLLPELPSYQTNATREQLVNVAYQLASEVTEVASTKVVDATHIEVTFNDGGVVKKELTTALVAGVATKVSVDYNGKSYEVEVKLEALKATGAKQTGAKAVTVTFNQAVSATDKTALTYALKYSLTSYPVTVAYSADNQSAVLTAAYLPAGDYTLSVKGSDDIKLSVVAETATKLEITAPAVQKAAAQDLGVKLYNQFGEAMTSISPAISAYNVTGNANVTVTNGTVDLSGATLGDSINVTAVVPSAGLSANKTLKVINGSAATSIKLDQIQPLTGDTRVMVGKTGYKLPLTMVDQNGQAVKLPATTSPIVFTTTSKEIGGLYFYVSDITAVNNFQIDSNGVVTFDTIGTTGGTVYISVTNAATQATASTSVVVNPSATVNQFQLSHPGKTVVKNEPIAFPYTAVDTFGAAITPSASINLSKVTFVAPGLTSQPTVNAKGELVFTFTQTGTFTVYVYVNGVLQPTNVQVTVNDPSYFTAVSGIHDTATTLEEGASVEFGTKEINIVDNYGRVTAAVDGDFDVQSSNEDVVYWDDATGKLVADEAGTATVTVSSTQTPHGTSAITSYTFTVTVLKTADIKSYAIDTVGTLYGSSSALPAVVTSHVKGISLVGKTASGVTVALLHSTPDFVSSSNEGILKVTGAATVSGQAAGKSTVTAYLNNAKVAEQEVTVSDATPVVSSIAFGATEYTTTAPVAPATSRTFTFLTSDITVKDQYGIALAAPFQILSSNPDVATTTANSLNVTVKAKGTSILTYVSSNGTTATTTLVVN